MARPFGTFKYDNVDDLEREIDKYFTYCSDNNEPYTIEGLALALRITPRTLVNYGEKEDYFPTIQYARGKCLAYNAKRMYDKDGVQGAKFNAINNSERMGGLKYADKIDVDMSGQVVVFSGSDKLED